jgi:hypothetical protein
MIPFAVTIDQAAAPHSSPAFMFWFAGIIVFPLMLIYTAISFSVFRGKVASSASGDQQVQVLIRGDWENGTSVQVVHWSGQSVARARRDD